jgi:TetR/AcrR family transcriptional repressor of nem operon
MLMKAGLSTRRRRGMPRGRDTDEQILNAAEDLLQRRGYNGFSYHHIAIQLGVRNAAVHYHFRSKEDLGVTLVKRYQKRFADWKTAHAGLDTWGQISAYFQTYVDFLEAGHKCCPGGVLGAEFHALPQPMREQARELMRDTYAWLVTTLERGRADGTLKFNGRVEDKAIEIGAALQGGLQIARLAGPERFHQVLTQLSLDLAGGRPTEAAPRPKAA